VKLRTTLLIGPTENSHTENSLSATFNSETVARFKWSFQEVRASLPRHISQGGSNLERIRWSLLLLNHLRTIFITAFLVNFVPVWWRIASPYA